MATAGTLEYLISVDSSKMSSGLSNAESKVKGFGNKLSSWAVAKGKVLGGLIEKAGEATVSFVKSSVSDSMSFNKSMSQVAATLGKTTAEVKQLSDFARKMGSETAFTAQEAAEGLNYMALAGYDAEKSMRMLPQVLDLAAAGNFALADASDMVTDAQSALGLSIEQTEAMVDQMAKTSSKTNTSVQQLGEAFLTVGGTAKNLRGGTAELSALLGVLANNGIKGAEGGTALRNVLNGLANPAGKAAKQLKQLNVDAYDKNGNLRSMIDILTDFNKALSGKTQEERTGLFAEMFNVRDLKSIEALLGMSAEDWKKLTAEIKDSHGAAKQMAETQLDNLAGDVTKFKSALGEAKIAIVENLTPTLRKFVKLGTGYIQRITNAFKSKGGLKGALKEVGTIFNEITSSMKNSSSGALRMLGGALEGIGNAISFVYGLIDNWDGTVAKLKKGNSFEIGIGIALESLKSTFETIVGLFTDWPTTISNLEKGSSIQIAVASVLTKFKSIFDTVVGLFTDWPTTIQTLKEGSDTQVAIASALEGLQGIVQTVVGLITDWPTTIQKLQQGSGMEIAIASLLTGLETTINTVVGLITDWPTTIEKLKAGSGIEITIAGILEGLKTTVETVVGLITDWPSTIEKLGQGSDIEIAIANALTGVQTVIETIVGLITDWPTTIQKLQQGSGIEIAIASVLTGLETTINTIVGLITNWPTTIENLKSGSGIEITIAEILEGLKGTIETVVGLITDWPTTIENLKQGSDVEIAIANALTSVQTVIETVVGLITNWPTTIQSLKEGSGVQITIANILEGLKSTIETVVGLITDWPTTIQKLQQGSGIEIAIASVLTGLETTINTIVGLITDWPTTIQKLQEGSGVEVAIAGVLTALETTINAIVSLITDWPGTIQKLQEGSGIEIAIAGVLSALEATINTVVGLITDWPTTIETLKQGSGIQIAIATVLEALKGTIETIVGLITDWPTTIENLRTSGDLGLSLVADALELMRGALEWIMNNWSTVEAGLGALAAAFAAIKISDSVASFINFFKGGGGALSQLLFGGNKIPTPSPTTTTTTASVGSKFAGAIKSGLSFAGKVAPFAAPFVLFADSLKRTFDSIEEAEKVGAQRLEEAQKINEEIVEKAGDKDLAKLWSLFTKYTVGGMGDMTEWQQMQELAGQMHDYFDSASDTFGQNPVIDKLLDTLDPDTFDALQSVLADIYDGIEATDSETINNRLETLEKVKAELQEAMKKDPMVSDVDLKMGDTSALESAVKGLGLSTTVNLIPESSGYGNAKGNWYVPYDNYPALLHRGEMVLNKSQARQLRDGEGGADYDTIGSMIGNAINQAMSKVYVMMSGEKVGDLTTKRVRRNINANSYSRLRALGG